MYLLLPHISQLPLQRVHLQLWGRDERSEEWAEQEDKVKASFTKETNNQTDEEKQTERNAWKPVNMVLNNQLHLGEAEVSVGTNWLKIPSAYYSGYYCCFLPVLVD